MPDTSGQPVPLSFGEQEKALSSAGRKLALAAAAALVPQHQALCQSLQRESENRASTAALCLPGNSPQVYFCESWEY